LFVNLKLDDFKNLKIVFDIEKFEARAFSNLPAGRQVCTFSN